jgi:hypothetical protein
MGCTRIAVASLVCLSFTAAAQSGSSKHAFTAKDWAMLRSAGAAAVSTDGTILYSVSFGGEHGGTHREWWTIRPDGTHATKLELPEGFTPDGFAHDGRSLYGTWQVNHLGQFAVFPVSDGKAAAVPTTVVLLPRGIRARRTFPRSGNNG